MAGLGWLKEEKELHCDSTIKQTLFKLIKIVNVTSLPGFHIRKQMPHPLSFGMGHQSVYLDL